MIDKNKLDKITEWLKQNIYRNPEMNFDIGINSLYVEGIEVSVIDVIATLHNYLYESVNNERYDYAFHWCNKCGGACDDDIFDDEFINKYKEGD